MKNRASDNYLKIDVEKVIASKSKRLAKWLPRFIIRYLKRIIHQEEINDFLKENHEKQGVDFTDSALKELNITYKIEGQERLNPEGRYLFASNHPLGGPDGIILISIFGRTFAPIKFMVNDILMHVKNVQDIFLPINKHGAQAKQAAKQIEEAYQSEATILTFPAGLVSRKQKGKIEDLEWKKSFIAKAIKHQRDIVPIHIDGRNSNFFYNLANIRKFWGLKANLEMLYLPDELFKQRDKVFTITIGEPISYKSLTTEKSHKQWAEEIKQKVYQLIE